MLGYKIALHILQGDVDLARKEAYNVKSLSVEEAKFLSKACKLANNKYGCDLKLVDFFS